MLAQRVLQQSLRRAGTQHAYRFAAPAAIATGSVFQAQRRHAAATTISQNEATSKILAQQRLNRPIAPHLGIYKPQVTWYLSALNRVTGSILSGTFYLFGAAYLIAPYAGWHLESAAMAAAFASWPVVLQFATKMTLALPFTFHSFNGLRHLVWDTGSMITNQRVIQTGWTVVGLSVVSSVILCLM